MGHCTLKSHGLESRHTENGKLFFNEPLVAINSLLVMPVCRMAAALQTERTQVSASTCR
jgi:hypothetical protein